jgi:hypothetical protein
MVAETLPICSRKKKFHFGVGQGCQMVYFQSKNPKLGIWQWVLQWEMLVYFRDIWSILRQVDIFQGHFVFLMVIWYIFPILGCCNKKNLATLEQAANVEKNW